MKLNVSAAIGVNQHNYSPAGKTLASPGNTFDHKLLAQKPPSNFTVFELFVCFQLRSATIHLLKKLKSGVVDLRPKCTPH